MQLVFYDLFKYFTNEPQANHQRSSLATNANITHRLNMQPNRMNVCSYLHSENIKFMYDFIESYTRNSNQSLLILPYGVSPPHPLYHPSSGSIRSSKFSASSQRITKKISVFQFEIHFRRFLYSMVCARVRLSDDR